MITHLELLVSMALSFLARFYYICDYCFLLYWLILAGYGLDKWGNSDMLHVSFIFLGMFSQVGHRCRERAETYKASQELGSELACHHLHHNLLAKACHRPTHKKDGKHILLFSERNFKVNGKGCRHKRGNVGEKLGLLIESIY